MNKLPTSVNMFKHDFSKIHKQRERPNQNKMRIVI